MLNGRSNESLKRERWKVIALRIGKMSKAIHRIFHFALLAFSDLSLWNAM